AAMVGLLGLGYFVASSVPVFSGLIERFTGDDGNSTVARELATNYIVENLHTVLIIGNGWGDSYRLKGTVLATSLENGYAILAFDIGGLMVAVLIAVQLRIILSRGGVSGSWLAGGGFVI